MMYHPDSRLEAMHRLTVAIEDARKARRSDRRAAWRVALGAWIVSAGRRIGGTTTGALETGEAGELCNC